DPLRPAADQLQNREQQAQLRRRDRLHHRADRRRRLRQVSRVAGPRRSAVLATAGGDQDGRDTGEGAVKSGVKAAALLAASLLCAEALAVRPVAKLTKGKLEDRAHPADIVGALAEFDGSRAEAMAAVRAAATDAGLQPDAIIVGLLAS